MKFMEWDVGLSSKLGQGAFATVYRGRYEGKDLAVKDFANLETVSDLRSVLEEAVVLQSVWHPNVLRSLGFSPKRGLLVSELAICSLSDLLYYKDCRRFSDFSNIVLIDSLL
jgi:serine/threonine protein kinase